MKLLEKLENGKALDYAHDVLKKDKEFIKLIFSDLEIKTLEALTGKDLIFKNATPSREILVEQNVLVKTLKINIINKASEKSIFKPIVL